MKLTDFQVIRVVVCFAFTLMGVCLTIAGSPERNEPLNYGLIYEGIAFMLAAIAWRPS
jgi:hypothetical protein